MKKLMTLMFLFPVLAFSQELTADSVAVAPTLLSQILAILYAALTTAIAGAIGLLIRQAIPLLNAYLKQIMHFRGAAVVADALTQALGELALETQKALADGVLTKEEWVVLKARARSISLERLKNLSGFYKSDLQKWVDDQLDVLLGKLLSRI